MESLWGMGGVLIGGLLTWAIQTTVERGRRRESRRRYTDELVGDFLQHVDMMWRGANDLMVAILETGSQTPEGRQRAESLRQAAFVTMAEPRRMATVLVARFRVIKPDLAQPAQMLMDASESFSAKDRDARATSKANAETTFLDAARKAIG